MDERVVKFRVGVMVLSTVMITGILVLLFGDTGSLTRSTYTLFIHFSDAPGVSEGTPVRKSGILIGRVSKVSFAKEGGVTVEAKIDRNVTLYRSEVPQVSGSLLGGDVVIQFVRRPNVPGEQKPTLPPSAPAKEDSADLEPAAGEEITIRTSLAVAQVTPAGSADSMPAENLEQPLEDGDRIKGIVAPNAFQVIGNMEGDLSNAINSLSNAGAEVSKLAASVNRIFADNDDQINRIVGKTERTIDGLNNALTNIDDVLGDQEVRSNLKRAIAGLPDLLDDTRTTVTTMRGTMESVDRNLRNLEGLTGPLGERGEEIVSRVDHAVYRLDELLGEMSDFGKKLNSGQGSLGQIMRNPELYQNLNAAARNIEQITRELKPILSDARVFSDKIARHPEILGVRGALQKNIGIK